MCVCVRNTDSLYQCRPDTGSKPVSGNERRTFSGAMPYIATGSRLSIGLPGEQSAGEMLAGRQGLGWMIFTGQDSDKTTEIILGMVIIGFTWIILDHYLLRPLEERTIERWGLVQR